ncbi:starch synthase 3, chloroplastic/amyloplastic-like isoform X1 [Cynara cardunculus var. scolymus]|uniref:starch synthase 3, chloroplastic/amyloplastic-like isoform X1 n=2 Tax=Cynara cardunculus var. scolymus TaxID=59895 RepID=UPI000D629903|nr:starch synthase 3, chloroplastic/amyloplastic-like isoform X1 [Cynara cardunculus var. scolymus]
MELALQVQTPLCCGRTVLRDKALVKIKPVIGFHTTRRTNLFSQFTQTCSWYKYSLVAGFSHRVTARSGFSRKRRLKMLSPRANDSAPKGFKPKPSNLRKDRKMLEGKEGLDPSTSTEYANHTKRESKFDVEVDKNLEDDDILETKMTEEISSGRKALAVAKFSQRDENGSTSTADEGTNVNSDITNEMSTLGLQIKQLDAIKNGDDRIETLRSQNEDNEEASPKLRLEVEANLRKKEMEANLRKKEMEEERRRQEMQANLRIQEIKRLASETLVKGEKVFCYPEIVTPDQDIEIFLNKTISSLIGESDVLIMGAFNDWRYKSFTVKVNKTKFSGEWWSCQIHVPKEAYKIDFVFFNGKDVYENNDMKDFCISVEGGMNVLEFEELLLEEKRRELERLAREQAERERQAEEQRRIESEKASSEADRAQARDEAERRRGILQEVLKKAVKFVDNTWYIEPTEFKGGDMVKLYYNNNVGPLSNAKDIWIHGGYNNWKDGLSIVEKLDKSVEKDGDWWYADVVVPSRSLVLDWVFADGSPQHATLYDNNLRQDFHAVVPLSIPQDLFWAEEEHEIYKKLQNERRLREEEVRAKAEKTARIRAETKERTMKTFLLSQKNIVYTDPLDVQAGGLVTVYYNPTNTVLNGKPEVWFRCSFNRWTHRMGLLPPQKMLPADNGLHVKTSVKVPLDAYMMDFVFSEKEIDDGVFDNKNGMDYHIPVSGGVTKEPPMHIVHISVEMAPIAKVGGLADVVTSLSRAVQDLNHTVDIILPKYDCLNLSNVKDFGFHKSYFWGGTEIKVWFGKVEGLSVYFLEPQNGLFWAGCIYGCKNDAERFGFFCHAALEFLLQSGSHPDVIHCHDWSSAPVAWLFKDQYMHYGLTKARIVFTIHNLEFGAQLIGKAMAYADKATTVSPTYSTEVSGNPVIAPHLYKFHGILNGIDPDIWDPLNDKFLPVSYTSENVVEGKKAAKGALQQKLDLKRADLPLVGIITRLTHQKGIHLIKHAIWRALHRGSQVVLLGSAPDPRIQNDFVNLASQLHSTHNDQARLCLTYDEPLSHLIYAGADFILVPSIFEPCGLTQLTAMRYGSIPIVRKTGGLYDTVFDVDHDKERAQSQGLVPNGFNFEGADAAGVDYAVNRAISAWYESRDWFNSLCKVVMEQDWSWNRPALDYLELYHAARK